MQRSRTLGGRASRSAQTAWIPRDAVEPGGLRHRLTELQPHHVELLLHGKLDDGLSGSTVRHIRSVLGRALGQAERWGLVTRNVARLVDAPTVKREEVKAVTVDDAQAIIKAVGTHRLAALYVTALGSGLRQSELFALTWADVDLDGGHLTVRRSLHRTSGRFVIEAPKTDKSARTVALPGFVVEALRAHRGRQLEERLRAGPQWNDTWDLVFRRADGQPLHSKNVGATLKKLLADAGLPPMRFHHLRHAAASLLIGQGVPLSTIGELLGHSDYALTRNVYAHLTDELKREAADALDTALGHDF